MSEIPRERRLSPRTGARLEVGLLAASLGVVLAAVAFLTLRAMASLPGWVYVLVAGLVGALALVTVYFIVIARHLSRSVDYLDGLMWPRPARITLIAAPLLATGVAAAVWWRDSGPPPVVQVITKERFEAAKKTQSDPNASPQDRGYANVISLAYNNTSGTVRALPASPAAPGPKPTNPAANPASNPTPAPTANPTNPGVVANPPVVIVYDPNGGGGTTQTQQTRVLSAGGGGLEAWQIAGLLFPPAAVIGAFGFGGDDEYTETTFSIIANAATHAKVDEDQLKKTLQKVPAVQRQAYVTAIMQAVQSAEDKTRLPPADQLKSIEKKMREVAAALNRDRASNAAKFIAKSVIAAGGSQMFGAIVVQIKAVEPNPTDALLDEVESLLGDDPLWPSLRAEWAAARESIRKPAPATKAAG